MCLSQGAKEEGTARSHVDGAGRATGTKASADPASLSQACDGSASLSPLFSCCQLTSSDSLGCSPVFIEHLLCASRVLSPWHSPIFLEPRAAMGMAVCKEKLTVQTIRVNFT